MARWWPSGGTTTRSATRVAGPQLLSRWLWLPLLVAAVGARTRRVCTKSLPERAMSPGCRFSSEGGRHMLADCGAWLVPQREAAAHAWRWPTGSWCIQGRLPPDWHRIAACLQPPLHFFMFSSTNPQSQRSRLDLRMGRESRVSCPGLDNATPVRGGRFETGNAR